MLLLTYPVDAPMLQGVQQLTATQSYVSSWQDPQKLDSNMTFILPTLEPGDNGRPGNRLLD